MSIKDVNIGGVIASDKNVINIEKKNSISTIANGKIEIRLFFAFGEALALEIYIYFTIPC